MTGKAWQQERKAADHNAASQEKWMVAISSFPSLPLFIQSDFPVHKTHLQLGHPLHSYTFIDKHSQVDS